MAYVVEGVSLFRATPCFGSIPAGGFVISASHLTSETPPVVGGALMLEEPRAQGLVESEPVVDLAVGATDHGVPAGDTSASAADTLAGSDHLENIDLIVALWKISAPMDLIVALWKILFHGLGCHPMENSVPWTWLSSYGKFLFYGLGCRPMEDFFVPWTWLLSYGRFLVFCSMDLVVVLWKNFCCSRGLGCCPVGDFWSHGLACRLMKGVDDAVHVSEDIDEVGITGEVTVVSPPRRPTIEAGSSIGVGSLSGEVADFLKEFDAKAPNPHPEQYFWSFNGSLVPFGDFRVPNDCSPYLSRLSAGHSDFTKGFKLSIGLGGPMLSLLGSVLAAVDESSLKDVTKTQILAWRSVIQNLMDVFFDLGFMIEHSLAELTAYQDEMMSTGRKVLRYGPSQFGADLDGEGRPLLTWSTALRTIWPLAKFWSAASFHRCWQAFDDLLVFSDLVSSSLSSAAAGAAAADCSVPELAVDCWVIRRGPVGGVENQPPSFLGCHRPRLLELGEYMGWALVSLLALGSGGWLLGQLLFMFCPLWSTGLVGLWAPGGLLRCWVWSTVD
uniref:Uncharacterized protein n=1 Tax=Fagus sylvatica TaxID=28930 RepID=A0A2N9EG33_FAGSY